jgi:hypothetical protein
MTRGITATETAHDGQIFNVKNPDGPVRFGYIVETARPEAYGSGSAEQQLQAFQKAMAKRFDQATLSVEDGEPTLTYPRGDQAAMELGWRPRGTDSLRQIGGEALPSLSKDRAWPLLKSPWVSQPFGRPGLTVEIDGKQWVKTFH